MQAQAGGKKQHEAERLHGYTAGCWCHHFYVQEWYITCWERQEDDIVELESMLWDQEPDSSPPLLAYISTTDPTVNNGKPLLFIYDCETTGGSHLRDHIMEVVGTYLLIYSK